LEKVLREKNIASLYNSEDFGNKATLSEKSEKKSKEGGNES